MSSPASFYSLPDSPGRVEASGLIRISENYSCGDKYDGTARISASGAKVKQGVGRYQFRNGSYYEGQWDGGSMSGKGRFVETSTGDRFEGTWEKGRRVQGVYYFSNGDLYIGGFDVETGHLKHGKCVIVEDMKVYEGVYEQDTLVSRSPFQTSTVKEPVKGTRAALAASSQPLRRSASVRSTESGRASSAASVLRSIEVDPGVYEAAKVILRANRDAVESRRSSGAAPTEVSHIQRFGAMQRGKLERFAGVRETNADVKDAFRFHYR